MMISYLPIPKETPNNAENRLKKFVGKVYRPRIIETRSELVSLFGAEARRKAY